MSAPQPGPVTVTVVKTQGSVPREAGAAMRVWPDRISGSIGGGALEWSAIGHARAMLDSGAARDERRYALGPDMGQCCGGAVTLSFERGAAAAPRDMQPLWIWGAGHVGRATAAVLEPLGRFAITLVDVDAGRFPETLPEGVAPLVAADPLRVLPRAPAEAAHLVVTYSHDLDLALCDALLRHGFAFAGLIGSATKWARFRKRLSALGHSEAGIARICCPIGDKAMGKHPQAIAIGVAAQLLSAGTPVHARREEKV